MNKYERLNDMLLYLNNLKEFNLKDIMKKYDISKSTALRDINSLEELGLPIYSESGRCGKYKILENNLLSPIVFTKDEIFTLYFAMEAINDYQSTPFHIKIQKLDEKFKTCLTKGLIEDINKMKSILKFHSFTHGNSSNFLNKILKGILNEEVVQITYLKKVKPQSYQVKFFRIKSKFGQWYGNVYDIKEEKIKVFRCDKITSIKTINKQINLSIETLNKMYLNLETLGFNKKFKIEISNKDFFYKENYPNMKLIEEHSKTYIVGTYNIKELNFLADYFISYGTSILSIEPQELKEKIEEAIRKLSNYYENNFNIRD